MNSCQYFPNQVYPQNQHMQPMVYPPPQVVYHYPQPQVIPQPQLIPQHQIVYVQQQPHQAQPILQPPCPQMMQPMMQQQQTIIYQHPVHQTEPKFGFQPQPIFQNTSKTIIKYQQSPNSEPSTQILRSQQELDHQSQKVQEQGGKNYEMETPLDDEEKSQNIFASEEGKSERSQIISDDNENDKAQDVQFTAQDLKCTAKGSRCRKGLELMENNWDPSYIPLLENLAAKNKQNWKKVSKGILRKINIKFTPTFCKIQFIRLLQERNISYKPRKMDKIPIKGLAKGLSTTVKQE